MFKSKNILLLKAITPMHVGSGSDLGIVDLPIQRERHTGFPKIEGSSLKGAIREMFDSLLIVENEELKIKNEELIKKYGEKLNNLIKKKKEDDNKGEKENEKDKYETIKRGEKIVKINEFYRALNLVFGPENAGDNAYASAVAFTDARLVLFPVKSVKGVFAWITCPEVIERFCKDLYFIGKQCNGTFTDLNDNKIYVNSNEKLVIDGKVVLEEYTFDIEKNEDYFKFLDELDIEGLEKERVAIVSNDTFRDFVEMSTEVITRVKIGSSGTVEPGALWTEEYLPAEAVLYSVVLAADIFSKEKGIFSDESDRPKAIIKFVEEVLEKGLNNTIFIGGNTTIGKGLTKVKFLKTDNNGNQQ